MEEGDAMVATIVSGIFHAVFGSKPDLFRNRTPHVGPAIRGPSMKHALKALENPPKSAGISPGALFSVRKFL